MNSFCFVLFKSRGVARWAGESHTISENTLLISNEHIKAYGEKVCVYYYDQEEIREISNVLNHLWGKDKKYRDVSKTHISLEIVPINPQAQQIIDYFVVQDFHEARSSFLFFCSLFVDWSYFSQFISIWRSDNTTLSKLISLLTLHACRPWPVARYAESLGFSVRKFNVIFYEKYGISAKRWLREKRLSRAATLLSETSMQIADVAEVCGFNNHAYFSSRFKKQYERTPREWREATISTGIMQGE